MLDLRDYRLWNTLTYPAPYYPAGYFEGSEENKLPSIAFWMDRGTYVAPPRPFIRKTMGRNRRKWTRKLFREGIDNTANSMKTFTDDSGRVRNEYGDFNPDLGHSIAIYQPLSSEVLFHMYNYNVANTYRKMFVNIFIY